MDLFEYATKNRVRFDHAKGKINCEQLWQLPLKELDVIAIGLNNHLKSLGEESFIPVNTSSTQRKYQIKLDIVKHVIASKVESERKAEDAVNKAQELERLKAVLAKKQDETLDNLPAEEIQKRISALSNGVASS